MSRKKKVYEFLIASLALLATLYALAPRYWEPSAESWKYWAAARILRDTGGFPGLDRSPLYVAYLQGFLLFEYPLSVLAEFFVTHMAVSVAIFYMLRAFLPLPLALPLSCAWVPSLAIVEGSSTVAGLGFVALYVGTRLASHRKARYLDPSLLAAALCRTAYYPFLLGHVLGVFLERRKAGQPLLTVPASARGLLGISPLLNAGMAVLIALTFLFPSARWDRDRMGADPKYAPIPLQSADGLTIAFFQLGNWKYVVRNYPPSSWIEKDWYLTHKEAFGGATTIPEALLKKPGTVALNLLTNVQAALGLPMFFLAGRGPYQIQGWAVAAIAWVLALLGGLEAVRRWRTGGQVPVLGAMAFGTAATVGALMLTWFSRRWTMALLPVGLILVVFSGAGLRTGIQFALGKEWNVRALGALLVLMGLGINPWILAGFLSRDHLLASSTATKIWVFDFLLAGLGGVLLAWPRLLRFLLTAKESRYVQVAVLCSTVSVVVLPSDMYPKGVGEQFKAVGSGYPLLLSSANDLSMRAAYRELLETTDERKRILTLDEFWALSFSRVDPFHTENVFSLPPFPDPSGETERWLRGLDAIWVSENWSKEEADAGTQSFLRYRLHVEPFVQKALSEGWSVKHVRQYGKIYQRPPSHEG